MESGFTRNAPDGLRHYTAEEAAEFLPVSAATLRHWAYARKVPHHKMGGNLSFSVADIQTMCAMSAVVPVPAPGPPLSEVAEQPVAEAEPQKASSVLECYFTVDEVAMVFRCSTKLIRDGVNHGGFPHSRMGRLLFSADDVRKIYEMHHVPAQPGRHRSQARRAAQARQRRSAKAAE
ncbi:helix-turn-helix domain-containing protein [Streptomyces sp. NBC_00212]|uniref:helix-turn-helix domain-containing protein n=1 Tax=Streptomyces sp. NBC_00212 TaxID=2975684 RepID=UPI003244BB7C